MKDVNLDSIDELPRARTKQRKWRVSLIWVVPVVAAFVAGYLVYERAREFGAAITIRFPDVDGIRPGQTPIRFRGAEIGQVTDVELDENRQSAIVRAKIKRNALFVACDGSVFWMVRPRLGIGDMADLGTLITGPYIEVQPGKGDPAVDFVGAELDPTIIDPDGKRVLLLSNHGGSWRAGHPLYYRGIEVGAVRNVRLSDNSTAVEIDCIIRRRYASLVRPGSKFWNVTGLDVRFGLFHGAELSIDSLKSLVIGGIAFATPEKSEPSMATSGTVFRLYDEPENEWLEWSPKIELPPENGGVAGLGVGLTGDVRYSHSTPH